MFRYFPKQFMMNSNEYKFYKLLNSFVDPKYIVIPQVHLDDLVSSSPYLDNKSRLFSFRHVNQKSVAFIVAEKTSMRALLAIELDGQSHKTSSTREQDAEKERILKEAGISPKRFENSDLDFPQKIKNEIIEALVS